ncbi:MAG TPA: 50S ribosomal protein L22 [Polyangia bacterium]|nr:50S ribosomal protein L22 [Polyangia bacterium]
MEATARLRFVRESSRKVRIVANMIRGKHIDEAMSMLKFQPRKAARLIRKLLVSAIANAANNDKADVEQLYVKRIVVDEGPTLKRWMPRAMGRATRLNKRTSHITVTVAEAE